MCVAHNFCSREVKLLDDLTNDENFTSPNPIDSKAKGPSFFNSANFRQRGMSMKHRLEVEGKIRPSKNQPNIGTNLFIPTKAAIEEWEQLSKSYGELKKREREKKQNPSKSLN